MAKSEAVGDPLARAGRVSRHGPCSAAVWRRRGQMLTLIVVGLDEAIGIEQDLILVLITCQARATIERRLSHPLRPRQRVFCVNSRRAAAAAGGRTVAHKVVLCVLCGWVCATRAGEGAQTGCSAIGQDCHEPYVQGRALLRTWPGLCAEWIAASAHAAAQGMVSRERPRVPMTRSTS